MSFDSKNDRTAKRQYDENCQSGAQGKSHLQGNSIEPENVNDHRAAAKDIVFKSRAARGSVCNVLSVSYTHLTLPTIYSV